MSAESLKRALEAPLCTDGGPAFPAESFAAQQCPGMTLRDWFAGQALASFVPDTAQNKAEAAYAIADAMLAERAKFGAAR
jgi:hypothetical protein